MSLHIQLKTLNICIFIIATFPMTVSHFKSLSLYWSNQLSKEPWHVRVSAAVIFGTNTLLAIPQNIVIMIRMWCDHNLWYCQTHSNSGHQQMMEDQDRECLHKDSSSLGSCHHHLVLQRMSTSVYEEYQMLLIFHPYRSC